MRVTRDWLCARRRRRVDIRDVCQPAHNTIYYTVETTTARLPIIIVESVKRAPEKLTAQSGNGVSRNPAIMELLTEP